MDVVDPEIEVNSPFLTELHDLLPECDLLVNRHLLDDLVVSFLPVLFPHRVLKAALVGIIVSDCRNPDIINRTIRIVLHLHKAGKRVDVRDVERVETVACHGVEQLKPEIQVPDVLDVVYAGVSDARIAGTSQVKRSMILESTLFNIWCDRAAFDSLNSTRNDDLLGKV